MPQAIAEFRIVDHGLEHEQYFQGHGVSFTRYTDCATGCGASAREAGNDALEQLACAGFAIPPALEAEVLALSDRVDSLDDCDDDDAACERWHYVSIDVRRLNED